MKKGAEFMSRPEKKERKEQKSGEEANRRGDRGIVGERRKGEPSSAVVRLDLGTLSDRLTRSRLHSLLLLKVLSTRGSTLHFTTTERYMTTSSGPHPLVLYGVVVSVAQ